MNKYERVYNIFKKHVDFEEGGGGLADHVIHAVVYEEYDETTETTSYSVTADTTPSEAASFQDNGETCVMVLAADDAGSVSGTMVLSSVSNGEFEYTSVQITVDGQDSSIMKFVVMPSPDDDNGWAYYRQTGNLNLTIPDE